MISPDLRGDAIGSVTDIDTRLFRDMDAAAAEAFTEAADLFPEHQPEALHLQPTGLEVTRFMARNLLDRGHRAQVITGLANGGDLESLSEEDMGHAALQPLCHGLVSVEMPFMPEVEIWADPAWQHRLDPAKRTPEMPKVLVGAPSDLRRFLSAPSAHGIPLIDNPLVFGYWTPPAANRVLTNL